MKASTKTISAAHHYKVGDILYNSWGYNQTNVDWYQVIKVKPKSIVIHPIAGDYKETGFLSGYSALGS